MTEENKNAEEKQSIFRSDAIDYFSSNAQFEQTLHPISYKKKFTWASFVVLCLGGIVWLLAGSIPIEAQGVGILIAAGGLSNIETAFNGAVKQIHAEVHTHVKQGDLLVSLYNVENEIHLEIIIANKNKLQQRLENLRKEVTEEDQTQKNALAISIEAANYKIDLLNKDIPIIMADVKNKEELSTRGLYDSQGLQQSKELLWSKQIELEKTKSNLSNFYFLLKKEYREEEIETINQQLLNITKEKDLLETQLQYKNIYSPIEGIVEEWFIQPNQYVTQGELLGRIEMQSPEDKQKIFYGYLPVETGKKIKLGAEVQMELTTVKSQEYGALLGNIVAISQYATSPEKLTRLINNQALINYVLQKNDAVIEVLIKPQIDSQTISGYRWTTKKGPPIELTSGTLCSFKGLVEEISPILYFFPAWRIKNIVYEQKEKKDKK